jgi:16S rRNA (uracil1498-N3)-methyltransferase
MRIPRIFSDQPLSPGAVIDLAEGPTRHLAQVLRLHTGDRLCLFDGLGNEAEGQLDRLDRKSARVIVATCAALSRESPLRITLAQGISRGERMDYTIQKAVELGVHAIAPITTERSTVRLDPERADKRLAHWRGVIIAACEQCGRNQLPALHPITPLHAWLARPDGDLRLLLRAGTANALAALPAAAAITLLIGPEGGLSEHETAAAVACGYRAVSLGPRILRTETAALTALAALQALYGDFR